ncbi:DUF6973 domain-containing protein [Maribacter sp. 2307ULW6-5]|uniref:DUF6973 domain-containing protein n=1 Tax=Maribacter sp. 2307ULW6-5 TaxID=3386275 RepID=UPI0039BCCDF4
MRPWQTLKRIGPKSAFTLLRLAVRYPHFLCPTFIATKQCMRVATLHYGREHYQNTPANAFRHAFWNYAIALRCRAWSNNDHSPLAWAKAITDWHEDAFANRPLARAMDLHNNAVGRQLFMVQEGRSWEETIALLREMTHRSVQISHTAELEKHPNRLVHLCANS